MGFLQHEDGGFVLLNLFLKHYVLVRDVDASNILGDDFHWVTDGLEGKNSVSWEYCPESTRLKPSTTRL